MKSLLNKIFPDDISKLIITFIKHVHEWRVHDNIEITIDNGNHKKKEIVQTNPYMKCKNCQMCKIEKTKNKLKVKMSHKEIRKEMLMKKLSGLKKKVIVIVKENKSEHNNGAKDEESECKKNKNFRYITEGALIIIYTRYYNDIENIKCNFCGITLFEPEEFERSKLKIIDSSIIDNGSFLGKKVCESCRFSELCHKCKIRIQYYDFHCESCLFNINA
jgi:hypothetical protein